MSVMPEAARPKTARQIIEDRVGRKLPATKELPKDLRAAIKRLAVEIIKTRREP